MIVNEKRGPTGAALQRPTILEWVEFEEGENINPTGTTSGNRMRRNQIGCFDYDIPHYPITKPVPNVTGPRQTKCIDFPDIGPDDEQPPVLSDVETPCDESPSVTVDCADNPRQETVPGLVWGAMAGSEVISDLVRELQPHDRDDIRQDMALKYWRKAVRQELRGQRISNLTKWLTNDVRQWIGERTDIATAGPLTKQQIDDAKGDTIKLQRDQAEQSRLASLDHELTIEQARYAAETEAKHRAAKPVAILAMQW